MTLTIPIKILRDAGVGPWHLHAFYCRYSAVLFYITMYISILLLGLISLDRCLKIVKPFAKCPLQRVRVGQILSAAVWVVMICLALPNVILSDQPPKITGNRLKCSSMKSKAGLQWHEGFNYFCQVGVPKRLMSINSRVAFQANTQCPWRLEKQFRFFFKYNKVMNN